MSDTPQPLRIRRSQPIGLGVQTQQPAELPVRPSGPRGYSAYEVAVQNGFVGTEPDWLSSLGSGGVAYRHVQSSASALWTVSHGLGFMPGGITVHDSGGEQWFGTIVHLSVNELTIDFHGSVFGGVAYIS